MPEPDPAPADALRQGLIEQLAYLIDEMDAMKAVAGRIPEPVRTARPPGAALSLKEMYGVLAVMDHAVHLPWLRRLRNVEEATLDAADPMALIAEEDWNAYDLGHILDRVQEARRALVAFLDAFPPDAWTRTGHLGEAAYDIYRLAHHITQHDAELLRMIGYRLYEARL